MSKAAADLRRINDLIYGRPVMFVDPGVVGTGIAFWRTLTYPTPDYVVSLAPKLKGAEWTYRTLDILRQFRHAVVKNSPAVLVIEDQSVFEASAKGYAASKDGSLIRLAQITGALVGVALLRFMDVYFLPVVTWKGQLPKRVTEMRVKKLTKVAYTSHVADAVGMGLAVGLGKTL